MLAPDYYSVPKTRVWGIGAVGLVDGAGRIKDKWKTHRLPVSQLRKKYGIGFKLLAKHCSDHEVQHWANEPAPVSLYRTGTNAAPINAAQGQCAMAGSDSGSDTRGELYSNSAGPLCNLMRSEAGTSDHAGLGFTGLLSGHDSFRNTDIPRPLAPGGHEPSFFQKTDTSRPLGAARTSALDECEFDFNEMVEQELDEGGWAPDEEVPSPFQMDSTVADEKTRALRVLLEIP